MINEVNDDPFDEIMNEGGGADAAAGKPARYISHGGSSGRYTVNVKELSGDELKKLSPEQRLEYQAKREIEEQLSDRGKFRAVILYLPEDPGRALWPDGTVFKGTNVICSSERTAAPYDVARVNTKSDPLAKQVLKKGGHTGQCSTCGIGTDFCKLRLVAYLVDLAHLQAIDQYNEAHPDQPMVLHAFSKLDAKGPQSYWNFVTCYKKLKRQAVSEQRTLGDYIVELSNEPGALGSKKVTFKVVGTIAKDDPLHTFVRILAREALESAKTIRKPFNALGPAKETKLAALPPGTEEVDGYIVPDEIPF